MINEHALPHIESDNGAITAAMEIIAVAGVISLGAWAKVYTPFTPVPFTLQTFSVLLAAFAVSPMRATAGALLYTALGLVGAPLFAGVTFGPTFGYILAFSLVPYVVSRLKSPLAGVVVATLTIYAVGVSWLSAWSGMSFGNAALAGVAPFVIGDGIKAAAAYGAARWLGRSSTAA